MPDLSIQELCERIEKANRDYYGPEGSSLSDQEYDGLKELLRSLDPDNDLLRSVGHEPVSSWEKAKHTIAMGSLNNVFNEEEFLKWASKFPEGTLFTAQPKLDGFSLSLVYDDLSEGASLGSVRQGITRGDGFIGEDITANVLRMKGVRQNIPLLGFVRGEVLLPKEDFTQINESIEKKYKNPRNAASGISRRFDGKFSDRLCFMPFDYLSEGDSIDEDKKIDSLREMGFEPPQQTVGDAQKMIAAFEQLKGMRQDYPFGIDGMVVKVCSSEIQASMGKVDNRPKAQIAWKFDPPGAVTKLIDTTFDVGRTGVVTPLGHVEPVEIDGSTVRKVTLHNVAEIKRLGIGIGDTVMLVKAGDIIPKITQIIEHAGNPIVLPDKCPSCKGTLKNDGVRLFCENALCPGKNLNRILNFIKVAEIDNLGESLIRHLYDIGIIRSIADICRMQKEDIASLEGWGSKSAGAICKNIENARVMKPETFLASIGIPSISKQTSKELISAFGDLDGVLNASAEDIESLRGFAKVSAQNITSGLKLFSDEIKVLRDIIKIDTGSESGGKLEGKSFCFTGTMTMPRKELQQLAEDNGGISHKSVTKDTDYLVCNEDKGSNKTQKAKKYGIPIITEEEYMNMLGPIDKEAPQNEGIENISLF